MILYLVVFFVGGLIGFFAASLCAASKISSLEAEIMEKISTQQDGSVGTETIKVSDRGAKGMKEANYG